MAISAMATEYDLIHPITTKNDSGKISNDYLSSLPLASENNAYYLLYPGTVTLDYRGTDFLHIRGSRQDEIGYMLEGVDIRNVYTGQPLFQIMPETIKNIELNTAPNVHMGSSRAMIQQFMGSRNPNRFFKLKIGSDNFTPMYQQKYDTFSYGWNSFSFTANSGLLWDKINFFIGGKSESYKDHYRMYWDGFSLTEDNTTMDFYTRYYDSINDSTVTAGPLSEYKELIVNPGNIPKAKSFQNTLHAMTTFKQNDIELKVVALYQDQKKRINNTPIYNIFNFDRLPELRESTSLLSFQLSYHLPTDYHLNLQFDKMNNKFSTYDPNFGDDYWSYADSASIVNKGLDFSRNYYLKLNHFYFETPGRLSPEFSKRSLGYNNIGLSISKKLDQHFLKFSATYKKHLIRKLWVERPSWIPNSLISHLKDKDYEKMKGWNSNMLIGQVGLSSIGYNIFGYEIDTADEFNEGPKAPSVLSLAISDEMDFNKLKLELGLHFQLFDGDGSAPKDSSSFRDYAQSDDLKSVSSNSLIMPRIGLSYQLNKNYTFHSRFGTYGQIPKLQKVYASRYDRKRDFQGVYNNGASLRPAISNQLEFGVQYHSERIIASTNLFVISTNDYLQPDKKTTGQMNDRRAISFYTNQGTSESKGVEFLLNYNGPSFMFSGNYTFSHVTGEGAYPISTQWMVDNRWGNENISEERFTKIKPLDYNFEHAATFIAKYNTSNNAPFLLKNLGITVIQNINSGHHETLYHAWFG